MTAAQQVGHVVHGLLGDQRQCLGRYLQNLVIAKGGGRNVIGRELPVWRRIGVMLK